MLLTVNRKIIGYLVLEPVLKYLDLMGCMTILGLNWRAGEQISSLGHLLPNRYGMKRLIF